MPIQRIPQQSVNSLISSSSIFSTCAVVKELIDNSIDANASDIKVEVDHETGGLKYCSVKDNGFGVDKQDRELMCCNCTTSKLTNEEAVKSSSALSELHTLGFRGEALFFISQLIQLDSPTNYMTIISKTQNEKLAEQWSIGKSGEVVGTRKAIASEVGTTVKLSGMFSSFTVRRNILLKQSNKLIEEIRNLVIAYALSYPKIRFSLKLVEVRSNNSISLSLASMKKNLVLTSSSSRSALLGQICKIRNVKKSFVQGVISDVGEFDSPVEFKVEYCLPIMTGDSESSTVQTNHTFLTVNGRPLDRSTSFVFRKISKLLKDLYMEANLLQPRVWSLHVELKNARDLDVNIEPLKNDVMIYKHEQFLNFLKSLLMSVVRTAHGLVIEVQEIPIPAKEEEEELSGSTFTVSNHNRHENATVIEQEEDAHAAIDNKPEKEADSDSEILEITVVEENSPAVSVPLVSKQKSPRNVESKMQDGDWNFNTHQLFPEDLEVEVEDSENNGEFVNEDLTLSADITLSNPFILSKIQSSKSSEYTSGDTTLVPPSRDTSMTQGEKNHKTVRGSPSVSKNVKEILTGNKKRSNQLAIDVLMGKKQKIFSPDLKLRELSEETHDISIFLEEHLMDIVKGSVREESREKLSTINQKLTSWYIEMVTETMGDRKLSISEGWRSGKVSKLELA